MRTCDALVVGAGPAGSAAAARLAAAGFEVILCDRDAFPRDKLCGQVLSPECGGYLRDLGAAERVAALGGAPLASIRFIDAQGREVERPFPSRGLGLRRYPLDAALVSHAVDRGASWLPSTRARARTPDAPVTLVRAGSADEQVLARAVIHASGRPAGSRDPGFVGVQRHYIERSPARRHGAVEMYMLEGGYCGIAPVDGGIVNVCLLARATTLHRAGGTAERLLASIESGNDAFAARIAGLEPVEEGFRTAAGFSFGLSRRERGVLRIGDAAGMIAPICGDGMCMALRSAEIAARETAAYLHRATKSRSWESSCERFHDQWKREVAGRMRLGGAVQGFLFSRAGAPALFASARAVPAFADWLIRRTRGTERDGLL